MMNFEDLNETTQLRLRNNGIKNDDDLINQLLDRIVELEEKGLNSKNKVFSKLEGKVGELENRIDNANISIEDVNASIEI